jgi:hypothetical protein
MIDCTGAARPIAASFLVCAAAEDYATLMNRLLSFLVLVSLASTPVLARAAEPAWFPFVLPWDDTTKTVTAVGALNPVPAGAHGFIRAKNGHFHDEKGQRVRFLGVNFVFSANFPEKTDAAKVAARMHKFGFNIVRLHHMDYYHAPQGIFDPRFKDKQHLDPEQLDRLDYLVYQLKQHGIYTNINLHVSRAFTAADGFPETDRFPSLGKVVGFFEPRMIDLQKNYARDLLTHFNPYTKTRYVDEPCIAVIEINNEDTLLGEAWGETLAKLPPSYKAELARQWNAWLKTKYSGTDRLKRAWKADKPVGPNLLRNADFASGTKHWQLETHAGARADVQIPTEVAPPGVPGNVARLGITTVGKENWHIQLQQAGLDLVAGELYTVSFWARADRQRSLSVNATLDQADWHNVGLSKRLRLGTEWRSFTFVFTAERSLKDHNRLSFLLGDAVGTVELAGLSLQSGVPLDFPQGATLQAGTIPLGRPSPGPAGQDWIAFLVETERRYLTALRDYIKNDLKAHANVTCSQASYGGLGGALRESLSDFTDMHAYWQHPEFPRKPWDPVDWRICNTAMTRDTDGGTLARLARYRLAGKPFTVSEYNHSAPHDYQAECVPMLAAFAALQDWDGLYLFDYNGDRRAWDSNKIRNFFSIDSNPAKMAFLPAAALLFLRGDLSPAEEEERLCVPEGRVVELLSKNGPDIRAAWEAAGGNWRDALTKRLSVSFVSDRQAGVALQLSKSAVLGQRDRKSGIQWQAAGTDHPVFTADSPSSKLMVGFLGGQRVQLPGWEVQMPATSRNFAALTLSAMDGQPVERSRSLLLTAVARVENTDMRWNADRTSVGNRWGRGPSLAEGVPAELTVRTLAKSAVVYALDGTGKRQGKVDAKLAEGRLTFAIGPAHKTLWYEVEANRER